MCSLEEGGILQAGREGTATSSQLRALRVRAPAGSTGPHRAEIVVLCHQGILVPAALQTAPEPGLQGQGVSAYPELHAAGGETFAPITSPLRTSARPDQGK